MLEPLDILNDYQPKTCDICGDIITSVHYFKNLKTKKYVCKRCKDEYLYYSFDYHLYFNEDDHHKIEEIKDDEELERFDRYEKEEMTNEDVDDLLLYFKSYIGELEAYIKGLKDGIH